MNRGSGRRIVFRDDADRRAFIDLISEFDERFGLEVHAYCLMGNHFHLLVRSREASLSRAMKWAMSLYTRETNARRGADGAIFRGRFHSVRVERDEHLDWLFRYVNANPLDLGWDRPLVDYPWSGMAASCGRRSSDWLRTDYVHSRFGDASDGRFERFVSGDDARRGDRIFTSPAVDLPLILQAASLTSAPGPDIHGRADIACVVAVAADARGLDLHVLFPNQSLSECRRRLRQAQDRIAARPDLGRFVERVDGILRSRSAVEIGV